MELLWVFWSLSMLFGSLACDTQAFLSTRHVLVSYILYKCTKEHGKAQEHSQKPFVSICNWTLFLRHPVILLTHQGSFLRYTLSAPGHLIPDIWSQTFDPRHLIPFSFDPRRLIPGLLIPGLLIPGLLIPGLLIPGHMIPGHLMRKGHVLIFNWCEWSLIPLSMAHIKWCEPYTSNIKWCERSPFERSYHYICKSKIDMSAHITTFSHHRLIWALTSL